MKIVSRSMLILALCLSLAPAARALQCEGLEAHERAGGHSLERHVGKDAAFLAARIREEHVSAASTFLSREDAERFVKLALEAEREQISEWLGERAARLVLKWRAQEVTGLSLQRRARAPRKVHGVRLVLQRDERMQCGYHLVTAYPEKP